MNQNESLAACSICGEVHRDDCLCAANETPVSMPLIEAEPSFEVAERIVKARMVKEMEKIKEHPEKDYPSISLTCRGEDCEWNIWVRCISPDIWAKGQTIEEAFQKLPSSEECIKARVADAQKKLAEAEAELAKLKGEAKAQSETCLGVSQNNLLSQAEMQATSADLKAEGAD